MSNASRRRRSPSLWAITRHLRGKLTSMADSPQGRRTVISNHSASSVFEHPLVALRTGAADRVMPAVFLEDIPLAPMRAAETIRALRAVEGCVFEINFVESFGAAARYGAAQRLELRQLHTTFQPA